MRKPFDLHHFPVNPPHVDNVCKTTVRCIRVNIDRAVTVVGSEFIEGDPKSDAGTRGGDEGKDRGHVAALPVELIKCFVYPGKVLLDPLVADLAPWPPIVVSGVHLAADGTSSLTSLTVSGDGRLVAYGVCEAGSDWTTFRLLNLASADQVEDALIQTKFSQAEWLPDHRSY